MRPKVLVFQSEICNLKSSIALPPLSIYNLSHMDRPSSFLVTLPKAELHLHLEGSIDPTTLIELRRRHGKTSTLSEIEQLYRYEDFNGFLMAFKVVTEDLQTADDYELITYRLMERLKAQNILHAEVYVSVGVC